MWASKFKIFNDCAMEEVGILRDKRYLVAEVEVDFLEIDIIDQYLPLIGIIQPKN